MDDGRKPPPPDDTPRPTWTNRLEGQPLRQSPPTRPLNPDDADALVPAADSVVNSAYGRTGVLPVRPLLDRGNATDALVIQKAAREARVLNFTVDGIQWRAGFAPEIALTPIGRHVRSADPPSSPLQDPTGFELRPSAADHERVLRDIIPAALLREEETMFGRGQPLGGFYLYYLPSGKAALAGACAWYLAAATGKAHCLYLQTEIKKADPRILDEMAKTFAASAVALGQQAQVGRPFDFWSEMRDARAEVRASIQETSLGRNAGVVRERVAQARESAEDRLFHVLLRTFDQLGEALRVVFVALPLRLVAGVVRVGSLALVRVVHALDRGLSRVAGSRDEPPGGD